MTFLYNLAFIVFGIFYLPVFLLKMKQAEDPGRLWRERLGILPEDWKIGLSGKRVVWLHAVSVGEVRAVETFIKEWMNQTDSLDFVLTTVTPTGQKIARELEGPRVHVCYFPFDLTFAVRRFFRVLNPACVLLAETEIWPNLLTAAGRNGIPAGVINGRLSERSFKRYKAFAFLLKGLWKKVDFVLAQTEEDAARFRGLGVASETVREMGNMKFDQPPVSDKLKKAPVTIPEGHEKFQEGLEQGERPVAERSGKLKKEWGFDEADLVFIAGSTHPGEEEILIRAFTELRKKYTALKMIVAPRHIERCEKLLTELSGHGFSVALSTRRPAAGGFDVLILNELGVLRDLYQIADLVVMGGSFVPHGGQNPIEPARFDRAALHGPHVFNFNKIYRELDQGGGAFEVAGPGDLTALSEKFLSDPALRREAGVKAREIVNHLRGASKRQAGWVLTFLKSRFPKERNESNGESKELFPTGCGGKMS